MSDFVEVLDDLDLRDLETSGPKFTWQNKRKGSQRVWEKLDRFVANVGWSELFPNATAINAEFFGFDHRAVVVHFNLECRKPVGRGTKRFLFENKWLLEDGFEQVVREAWGQGNYDCSLPDGVRKCGNKLQAWATENTENIARKIKEVSRQVEAKLCCEEDKGNSEEVRRLEVELDKLYTEEELHWHQRSRNNWLALADRNTSFFHRCASVRRARNRIRGLMTEQG
ncbi:hypothetical protein ACS0TY_003848 [Phlomoides rotata]